MTATVMVALAAGAGLCSALVPLINAEAYALASAGTMSNGAELVLVVLALSLGQTAGKVVLFESARRGAGRWSNRLRRRHRGQADRRWIGRMTDVFASTRRGSPVVLAAATVGIPPLALTSIAAGASGQPRRLFIPICLVGRTARFLVLILPVAHFLR